MSLGRRRGYNPDNTPDWLRGKDDSREHFELIKAKSVVKKNDSEETLFLVDELEKDGQIIDKMHYDIEQLQRQMTVYQQNFGPLIKCDCDPSDIHRNMIRGGNCCSKCDGNQYYVEKVEKK